MKSANDACVALAEKAAGSEAAFAQQMNLQACILGCSNTNFCNSNGLPAENHYSSAYDLAVMTRAAMQQEVFAASLDTVTVCCNSNCFNSRYPVITFVKLAGGLRSCSHLPYRTSPVSKSITTAASAVTAGTISVCCTSARALAGNSSMMHQKKKINRFLITLPTPSRTDILFPECCR